MAASPEAAPGLPPAIAAQIDRAAKDEIHAGHTPGLAIGIVEDGRLVYAQGFGFSTLDKHVPMTAATEFYLGGITMQFTAAAVMLLVQDGKIKLDDKVTKYVPELRVAGDATVAQLLTQMSGLPDYLRIRSMSTDPTRSIKLSTLIAAVNQLKPSAPPGAVFQKNVLNYLVAGLVVERVSGVTLSDYLQQHIFLPLVMDQSFLAGDSGISPARATGYTHAGRDFAVARAWDPAWMGGASGLVSTVDDMAKWDIEMPILLHVDSLRTIFTPAGSNGPTQYGMGWVIDRRGGKNFVWYNGEIPGYSTVNALLPDDHIAVIVLANADSLHGGPVAVPEDLAARILDIVMPPATTQLDNAIVARAKEWLQRLATRHIDRTELTPSFSAYLTDDLVARENFGALGTLQSIVPISSTAESNGDTLYEFLVRYPRVRYHYKFAVTPNGKVDEIALVA